ncbi:MAG: class I SAM-dependent methyltransferase [Kofleriaceae bacterium]
MQPSSRTAAELIRSRLLRNEASPALVRSTLQGVPTEDRDAWLDLLLDVEDIRDDGPDLPRGCVPYLPCPVSIVLDVVDQAEVTSTDVFVDVGAGIGRTLFLTHLLTGAGCIGIEIQASLTKLATGRAAWLNLTRTRFLQADAIYLTPFITIGTVFFLYCPFSGQRVERFLDGLESIAQTRQIRVCCVDMAPLERPWLTRLASTSPELDLYRSR